MFQFNLPLFFTIFHHPLITLIHWGRIASFNHITLSILTFFFDLILRLNLLLWSLPNHQNDCLKQSHPSTFNQLIKQFKLNNTIFLLQFTQPFLFNLLTNQSILNRFLIKQKQLPRAPINPTLILTRLNLILNLPKLPQGIL